MRVIGNRILVKEIDHPQQTETGLYLPDTADRKFKMGEVIEVGEGTEKEVMKVVKGDTVYFTQYAGDTVTIDGEEYKVIKQDDVLVIL